MKWRRAVRVLVPVIAAILTAAMGFVLQSAAPIRGIAYFAATASADAAEGNLFVPIAKVLREPRCMNCHPVGDRPRQGDDCHLHLQNVTRGPDDLGFVNLRCTACHRDENSKYSGVPGAPNWHLAPLSMGWEGLNDAQLCEALKDKSKNGGRDVPALVAHMAHDKLVLWGWSPGGNRAPVSIPHDEFVKQLQAWAKANAPCPTATP